MKIIGNSKVATNNKVTLVEPVVDMLKIQSGDVLVYLESTRGQIIIKNQSDIEIKEETQS